MQTKKKSNQYKQYKKEIAETVKAIKAEAKAEKEAANAKWQEGPTRIRARIARKAKKAKPLGFILFEGPSVIDGAPIVVIATAVTKKAANRKTGDMVQIVILRADVSPTAAIAASLDVSICGNCPHRGGLKKHAKNGKQKKVRTCYVNVGQGPNSIWKAYKRGRYVVGTMDDVIAASNGKAVRLGTYGDPAAAPFEVWQALLDHPTIKRTGYTHQWRNCDQRMRNLCQASCDSVLEAADAAQMGWHAFIVRPANAEGTPSTGRRSIECLADRNGLDCATCGACNGLKIDVWIRAHGTAKQYVG